MILIMDVKSEGLNLINEWIRQKNETIKKNKKLIAKLKKNKS